MLAKVLRYSALWSEVLLREQREFIAMLWMGRAHPQGRVVRLVGVPVTTDCQCVFFAYELEG